MDSTKYKIYVFIKILEIEESGNGQEVNVYNHYLNVDTDFIFLKTNFYCSANSYV